MIPMRQIKAFGRKIGKAFHPSRVILFGSYALGTATEDSDVDLLVIQRFEGRPVERSVAIRMELRPPFPVDILVRTPESVQRRLDLGDPFLRDILDSGEVLYESPDGRVGGEG